MAKNNSDLFIICGEKSGDNYGSEIISYLLKKIKISEFIVGEVIK